MDRRRRVDWTWWRHSDTWTRVSLILIVVVGVAMLLPLHVSDPLIYTALAVVWIPPLVWAVRTQMWLRRVRRQFDAFNRELDAVGGTSGMSPERLRYWMRRIDATIGTHPDKRR